MAELQLAPKPKLVKGICTMCLCGGDVEAVKPIRCPCCENIEVVLLGDFPGKELRCREGRETKESDIKADWKDEIHKDLRSSLKDKTSRHGGGYIGAGINHLLRRY